MKWHEYRRKTPFDTSHLDELFEQLKKRHTERIFETQTRASDEKQNRLIRIFDIQDAQIIND